ncbi:MAG: ArsC family reductase [Proteobacteria bacterium]|nr:ArsC family reductase [Pseudomonadota bacterium]
MIKLYGIKNCDTVKKSMNWLSDNNIKYQFHDYKKDGIDEEKLAEFIEKFGFEKLLNRKGTTWRQMTRDEQNKIIDNKSALELMRKKPSIIKRPIADLGSNQLIGFDIDEYQKSFCPNRN